MSEKLHINDHDVATNGELYYVDYGEFKWWSFSIWQYASAGHLAKLLEYQTIFLSCSAIVFDGLYSVLKSHLSYESLIKEVLNGLYSCTQVIQFRISHGPWSCNLYCAGTTLAGLAVSFSLLLSSYIKGQGRPSEVIKLWFIEVKADRKYRADSLTKHYLLNWIYR